MGKEGGEREVGEVAAGVGARAHTSALRFYFRGGPAVVGYDAAP